MNKAKIRTLEVVLISAVFAVTMAEIRNHNNTLAIDHSNKSNFSIDESPISNNNLEAKNSSKTQFQNKHQISSNHTHKQLLLAPLKKSDILPLCHTKTCEGRLTYWVALITVFIKRHIRAIIQYLFLSLMFIY